MIVMAEKSKRNKEQGKEYHYSYIQFTVSDEDKKLIEEYTEKSGLNTLSKFIREAVNEKIARMNQSESIVKTKDDRNSSISLEQIEKIIDKRLKQRNEDLEIQLNKLIDENQRLFHSLFKNFELIQTYVNQDEIKHQSDKIANLLKAHKSLTQQEIMDLTDLSFKESFKILSNTKRFKLNTTTGRWSLK